MGHILCPTKPCSFEIVWLASSVNSWAQVKVVKWFLFILLATYAFRKPDSGKLELLGGG